MSVNQLGTKITQNTKTKTTVNHRGTKLTQNTKTTVNLGVEITDANKQLTNYAGTKQSSQAQRKR
jgi:hypothetical protein